MRLKHSRQRQKQSERGPRGNQGRSELLLRPKCALMCVAFASICGSHSEARNTSRLPRGYCGKSVLRVIIERHNREITVEARREANSGASLTDHNEITCDRTILFRRPPPEHRSRRITRSRRQHQHKQQTRAAPEADVCGATRHSYTYARHHLALTAGQGVCHC